MLFPYFVYIMHLTKFTCGSSLLMKRPLIMEGKHWLKKTTTKKKKRKTGPKKNDSVPFCHNTIKITLWKPLVLAELHAGNHTRFPFLYASTSLDTKILKIAQNCGFECCLWISYLAAQHILQFSHFCCGFCPWLLPLPLATLLIIVSSSVTPPWAIKIKKIYIHVCNGLLFLGNLDPLSLTPWGRIVPLVLLFQERR